MTSRTTTAIALLLFGACAPKAPDPEPARQFAIECTAQGEVTYRDIVRLEPSAMPGGVLRVWLLDGTHTDLTGMSCITRKQMAQHPVDR